MFIQLRKKSTNKIIAAQTQIILFISQDLHLYPRQTLSFVPQCLGRIEHGCLDSLKGDRDKRDQKGKPAR